MLQPLSISQFFQGKKGRWPRTLVLVFVLALGIYLRFVNLADNPGWYTDEGTHLDIARHLLQGRVQYLAVNQSTLLFARLPPFELLLAGMLRLWDGGMLTLRALTAGLGVLSVGLMYVVVRWSADMKDEWLPMLAAFMLATYPLAVLYSRLGFSYNLLAPLALLAYLGLSRYIHGGRRAWLALAALAIGTGGVSDLMLLTFVPVLVIVVLSRRWRDMVWSLPLTALPWAIYAGVMLATAPDAFLYDLQFTMFRVNGLPLLGQLGRLAINYAVLLTQDPWLALALIGVLMMPSARQRALVLMMLLFPITLMGRTWLGLYSLGFYHLIPVLPFLALGLAALLRYGLPAVMTALQSMLVALLPHAALVEQRVMKWTTAGAFLLCAAITVFPLVSITTLTTLRAQDEFGTVMDSVLLDPNDARQVAGWVNDRLKPVDVVITSPGLGWMVQANVTDFQVSVAADHMPTSQLPSDLPPGRFAFDPRLDSARYVIVDNLWRNWAILEIPAVNEMLHRVEEWPMVFKRGQIEVYQNPAH